MNSNSTQAGRGSAESPLVLALKNIGPLKEASIELGKGLTVLYGLNGTGKTTVAKALRFLARLNTGTATAEDAVKLVKRHLKHVLTEKEAGMIAYSTADAELEVVCIPDVRGARLRIGEWERHVAMNEKLLKIDKPKIALLWAAHDSVELHGIGEQEGCLSMSDLLTPSTFRNIAAHLYDDVMDLYEEVLDEVNKVLETIDYFVEYRDVLYFKKFAHVYIPDEVASGVRRFALILLTAVLGKKLAEYAKIQPVIYIENIEDSLDVTLMSTVINILRSKDVISVVETHSGFPLRAATTRKKMNYYVFADGRAVRDLKAELFKKEVAEWADVNAL